MFKVKIGYSWELKKWVAVVLELAGIRRLSFHRADIRRFTHNLQIRSSINFQKLGFFRIFWKLRQ